MTAFFELHKGLHREGPGEPADIDWVVAKAGVLPDARICDAACGPGADIATWLTYLPDGHVTGIDLHAGFVTEAQARLAGYRQARVLHGDIKALPGTYDLIWSAGAVYFLGVETALKTWRSALNPSGVIAFSQVCWFTDTPSAAPKAFWDREYPEITDASGIADQIAAAGYTTLATRRLSPAAWAAYYDDLTARVTALRPGAGTKMAKVLDEAEEEITLYRDYGGEFGYLLTIVQPK